MGARKSVYDRASVAVPYRGARRVRAFRGRPAQRTCGPSPTPPTRATCCPSRYGTRIHLPDSPVFPVGEGTFSATPLGWPHAQFVRLAWSIDAGYPVEQPEIVAERYGNGPGLPGTGGPAVWLLPIAGLLLATGVVISSGWYAAARKDLLAGGGYFPAPPAPGRRTLRGTGGVSIPLGARRPGACTRRFMR